MLTIKLLIATAGGIILGFIAGFWIRRKIADKQIESIKDYSKKIINDAHRKAKTIKKEAILRAKDTLYQMKVDFEKETKEKKEQLQAQERRLFHKEENLDKKIEVYEKKERGLIKREGEVNHIEEDLKKKILVWINSILSKKKLF